MLCLMFIPMGRIRETKRKRRVVGKNRRAGVKRTLVGFVGFRVLHRVDVLERLIVVVMLIRYQYQALLVTAPSLGFSIPFRLWVPQHFAITVATSIQLLHR